MAVVLALALAVLALAEAVTGPIELAGALAAGNVAELDRLGATLGGTGLTPALLGTDRGAARGALVAAEAAADRHGLLPVLRHLASGRDRPLAAAAARVAARIAGGIDAITAGDDELTPEALDAEAAAWCSLAFDPERYADVRVAALEIGARLGQAHGAVGVDLARALADREPELRRAALELIPLPPPPALAAAITGALADADPDVATAAARTLARRR